MKPIDLVDNLILRSFLGIYDRVRFKQPGSVVLNLSEEERVILNELKSDDVANIRPDAVM